MWRRRVVPAVPSWYCGFCAQGRRFPGAARALTLPCVNPSRVRLSLQQCLAWRLLACLVALVLLGRFALPAGVMPAAQQGDGAPVLSLCHGGAVPGWALPDPGAPADDGVFDTVCPFGVLAMQALAPGLSALPADAAYVVLDRLPPVHRALPALPATGPPLGPRAPPRLLA